jgi:ribosomal protein S18 acetylase RimI-like enzyme
MGPEARALTYLHRVIRADHAIVAVSDSGRLLGLAGFKTAQGSFAAGSADEMRASYGIFGGTWRARLLGWLSDEIDNENFLLDGLCVIADGRGQGIGSSLMGAIAAEARLRGYASVRLDVIESNERARALYHRLGYVVTKRADIGMLRHVFGFRAAVTMVRQL